LLAKKLSIGKRFDHLDPNCLVEQLQGSNVGPYSANRGKPTSWRAAASGPKRSDCHRALSLALGERARGRSGLIAVGEGDEVERLCGLHFANSLSGSDNDQR
jgi:hypothetical protein